MLRELLKKINLFSLLHQIDMDLANQCRQKRCSYCGGPLHLACYKRKPRGGPENLLEEYMVRQSLCCGQEGCRRRTLPPSCLFMGRRVYWGCVILVVMVLRQTKPRGAKTGKLMKMFGIDRKTLFRWIGYFRDQFPRHSQWQSLRGRISPVVQDNELPTSLVRYFLKHTKSSEEGLIQCLRFLAIGGNGTMEHA